MNKIIFGKNVHFNIKSELLSLVEDNLSLYENTTSNLTDVIVSFNNELKDSYTESVNPKILTKLDNGFISHYRNIDVAWFMVDDILNVNLKVKDKSKTRDFISKIISMEFSTQKQMIGQILHELVLVPMTYFFKDIMPIHAATISKNNKAYLFTGTGGVGKSSALLALKDLDVGFISDDIAIISKDAIVYGNMAEPKIYGYNCIGNEMKDLILSDKSIANKLHFKIKNKINTQKVRRKIKPSRLFNQVDVQGTKIEKMFFLFRENTSEFSVEKINANDAKEMSISIISSEYSDFNRFIEWYSYNCTCTKSEAIVRIKDVISNWNYIFDSAFSCLDIFKITIPLDMKHQEYQIKMRELGHEL
ncbi:hypothetical protein [Vibrio algicola]|uniref:HPr kinase n=1 Tax=Vibrio algicola TaxID=2662262 RepID=A0A5Q0TAL7_9VIBR|nr:hypothetical protein [Vibrio algicola]